MAGQVTEVTCGNRQISEDVFPFTHQRQMLLGFVSTFIQRKMCCVANTCLKASFPSGVKKNGLAGSKAVPGTSQWVPDQYFREATWWRVKGISNDTAGQMRLSASCSIIAQNGLASVAKQGESGDQ